MRETIVMGGLTLDFLHSKDETEGSLDAFRMTVQPKARVPAPHYHESWDETVYGLGGTLVFRIDGVDRSLAPGESLFIKRGAVHGFTNASDEPGSCLCVLTPGVLGKGYFREIAAEIAGGAPDPARIKAIMLAHRLIPAP